MTVPEIINPPWSVAWILPTLSTNVARPARTSSHLAPEQSLADLEYFSGDHTRRGPLSEPSLANFGARRSRGATIFEFEKNATTGRVIRKPVMPKYYRASVGPGFSYWRPLQFPSGWIASLKANNYEIPFFHEDPLGRGPRQPVRIFPWIEDKTRTILDDMKAQDIVGLPRHSRNVQGDPCMMRTPEEIKQRQDARKLERANKYRETIRRKQNARRSNDKKSGVTKSVGTDESSSSNLLVAVASQAPVASEADDPRDTPAITASSANVEGNPMNTSAATSVENSTSPFRRPKDPPVDRPRISTPRPSTPFGGSRNRTSDRRSTGAARSSSVLSSNSVLLINEGDLASNPGSPTRSGTPRSSGETEPRRTSSASQKRKAQSSPLVSQPSRSPQRAGPSGSEPDSEVEEINRAIRREMTSAGEAGTSALHRDERL